MDKQELLFICGNISSNSSQGVRYSSLFPVLAKYYNITVLSYNHFYSNPGIKSIFLNESSCLDNLPKKKTSVKKYARRLYKRVIRPFIFPDRYKFELKKYKEILNSILTERRIEKVIIGMTPFSLYELARYIKKQSELEVICDLSDPFSFNANNQYAFSISNRSVFKYEKRILRSVDKLVVLNEKICELYRQRFDFEKTYVIEQGLNEQIAGAKKKSDIIDNSTIELIYAGGLYKEFREAYHLYDAVESMIGKLRLDIFGNINDDLLPELNVENISYQGVINFEHLLIKYGQADCIVFIDNEYGYQVPGKILEIQEFGKPILFIYSNPDSPTIDYLFNDNIIMVKNDKDAIRNGLINLLDEGKNSVKSDELSAFYWANLAKKYAKLIND